jgi:sodium pump decarboxylase gamma subunit
MKQFKKQVLSVLLMAACLFALTACTAEVVETNVDAAEAQGLQSVAQAMVEEFTSAPEANVEDAIRQYRENDMEQIAAGLEGYLSVRKDLGAYVSTEDGTTIKGEDGYTITLNTVFEKRPCQFVLTLDKRMANITSLSFTPHYTMGENMTKAGLNTLMGMGTVFLVLIFISWLISCFKYIGKFEGKMKHPHPPAPLKTKPSASAKPQTPAPEENLADDLELVAVITAAIAASEGTPADGLVVRSIRRAPGNKWKRA